MIHQFWVCVDPAVLLQWTHSPEFQFLAQPESYDTKFVLGESLQDLPQGFRARPLSHQDIHDNKFWRKYRGISSPQLSPWDRQEPIRAYTPIRLVPAQIEIDGVKIYAYPPEAFLFPSGWAGLLTFSIHGSLSNAQLPRLLAHLSEKNWIRQPSQEAGASLDALVNQVQAIVIGLVYQDSRTRPRLPIWRNRIIAILDRENPEPHESRYVDKAEAIVYGSVLGREVLIEALDKVPDSFTLPLRRQFSKIKYQKEHVRPDYHWKISGWVYFHYRYGIFLDLPVTADNAKGYSKGRRFVRCLATNLRNEVIMVNLLQGLVSKSYGILPRSDEQLRRIQSVEMDQMRKLCRLAAGGQQVLREISSWSNRPEPTERIGKVYVQNHKYVQEALQLALPSLG